VFVNPIVNLWIGDALGPIERACMRSVLKQGHQLVLYSYGDVQGVPEGVEIRDASEVLPRTLLPADWHSRSDLYSDWFRYEIQKRDLGIWLDLDVYLLAPLRTSEQYVFGEYERGKINGAVLRIPSNAPILGALLDQFKKGALVRAVPWERRLATALRKLAFGVSHLSSSPWGSTGPFALTRLVPQFGLSRYAEPPEVFYPVRWQDADWIMNPSISLEDVTTEATLAIHLWNECIRGYKHSDAPSGSFLERLQREGRP
jgi:hypothetical protein